MLEGVLFIKVDDAFKASYKIDDPEDSVLQLIKTMVRSEIGKQKLDSLFQQREHINHAVQKKVNSVTKTWGINTMRYEISGIDPYTNSQTHTNPPS